MKNMWCALQEWQKCLSGRHVGFVHTASFIIDGEHITHALRHSDERNILIWYNKQHVVEACTLLILYKYII